MKVPLPIEDTLAVDGFGEIELLPAYNALV